MRAEAKLYEFAPHRRIIVAPIVSVALKSNPMLTDSDFLHRRIRLLAEEGRVCIPFSEIQCG
jgi:hypothetical protein